MKQPKYVRLEGTVLRFREEYNDYWVDNGHWGVGYTQANVLYDPTDFAESRMIATSHSFKGKRLFNATEKEWLKSVGSYVPSGYILEDGSKYRKPQQSEYTEEQVRKSNLPQPIKDAMISQITPIVSINKYKYLLLR